LPRPSQKIILNISNLFVIIKDRDVVARSIHTSVQNQLMLIGDGNLKKTAQRIIVIWAEIERYKKVPLKADRSRFRYAVWESLQNLKERILHRTVNFQEGNGRGSVCPVVDDFQTVLDPVPPQ